jgi:mono/diheme cytochrome c family protein
MKLLSLVLTCAVIVVFSVACTETVTPTNTSTATRTASPAPSVAAVDPFAAAQANYQKHCEACHGPNGEGGLVKVEDKQIKVASLKSDHARKHSDAELTKIITSGEEEMPAFKDKLNAEQITELVRYVRHHFQGTN